MSRIDPENYPLRVAVHTVLAVATVGATAATVAFLLWLAGRITVALS